MIYLIFLLGLFFPKAEASEISFTMDDLEVSESPLLTVYERNRKILHAFKSNNIKGALFVCGMRIDSPEGKELVKDWGSGGHIIANHSYSHLYYHGTETSFVKFKTDFEKVEPLITHLKGFTKLFRFPYLKEGNTREKRDEMRAYLKQKGYRQGYVTIDASDWYVDQRLREKLKKDPKADLTPYKEFYLKHIWDRAQYYDQLAKKVTGRPIKHTLLIHHSLLNALFLEDLMRMFVRKKWKLISAVDAFKDPIFKLQPNIIPAGESIVWAAAKETGRFDDILRYPAEDGEYEKDEMDKKGL